MMNKFIFEESKKTESEINNSCLEFFSKICLLKYDYCNLISLFLDAYNNNRNLTLKTLLYLRDEVNGLGEKNTFRFCLNLLGHFYPDVAVKFIPNVIKYGNYNDLISFLETPIKDEVIKIIKKTMEDDLQNQNLTSLCVNLPYANSVTNENSKYGKMISDMLGYDYNKYDEMLNKLKEINSNIKNKYRFTSKIVQNQTDKNNSLNNDYSTLPSEVIKKIIKINDGESIINKKNNAYLDNIWESLKKDYSESTNTLVVLDTSSSMYYKKGKNEAPAITGISFALFYGEMLSGDYKNKIVTFSKNPDLTSIKGDNICEKVENIVSVCQNENANLEKILELVYNVALSNKTPLPNRLLIISDSDFDKAISFDNDYDEVFKNTKKMYEEKGLVFPEIVYWNVANKKGIFPIEKDKGNVKLINGYNIQMFRYILNCKKIDSFDYMKECLRVYDEDLVLK